MGGSNLINKDIVGALCLGWGVEWVGKVLKRQEERVQAKARTGKQAVKSCIFFFFRSSMWKRFCSFIWQI